VRRPVGPRHLPAQHSESVTQASPFGRQRQPQSALHEQAASAPLHIPSPQHAGGAGASRHIHPPVPQSASLQLRGFTPSPSPQQKRFARFPLWRPLQSIGQITQSSPSPALQMPSPQEAPALDAQSLGQPMQSSPGSHTPSKSQTGHPVQLP
jgi:hypothetical protein